MEIEEKKRPSGASFPFFLYDDWSTGRLSFSQGHLILCALSPPPHTHTHTDLCFLFPPLTQLSSQVRQAHWGPWGGGTKIVIGSSVSSTALRTSHIWSSLRWQAVQRDSFIRETSSKRPRALRTSIIFISIIRCSRRRDRKSDFSFFLIVTSTK